MAVKAMLFDLDGTIWDSYPVYARVIAARGGDAADRTLRRLREGYTVIDVCSYCKVSFDLLCSDCAAHAGRADLYNGVVRTLEALRSRGLAIGAVSSLSPRLIRALMAATKVAPYFDTVIHPGNCRARKPSAGPIFAALRDLDCAAENSYYVGDMQVDAEAARRAGVSFAWAAYGYGQGCPEGALRIDTFREVLDL